MAKVTRETGELSPKKKKKKTDDTSDGFVMPTSKSKPATNLWAYILLLFGEKKIGKTSMLAENADKTFFFMFEPGAKALEVYSHLFTRWADFKLAVTAFIKDPRFDIGVIDTVDLAYKMSEAYTYKKLGIEHASDESYGKGWAAVKKEFTDQIMRIVNSGKGVVFVSHATEKKIEIRGGGEYDMITTSMPNQARDVIEGLVDIWAYYGYDGSNRVLTIQGSDHISAGHRLTKHFKTADGGSIREIPMGTSAKEAYQNFLDAFHNRLVVTAKPVVKKSPGDVVRKLKKKS
jgi:hypothetical protein